MTDDDFVAHSSDPYAENEAVLQATYAQAVAELNRLRERASIDASTTGDFDNYSMHDAAGMGTYVIPRRTGWKALLAIIHDPVPNIDFSANIYPNFDGIIGEHFESPYLLDPLNEKYESYESLRDNLAAVRNFLMQTYYANTPEGMSPEKAAKAMEEIAAFVGDGLNNNWLYRGLIPFHNPNKPYIDLDRAREKNGKGAQYIYEKILEHQRHSSWLRPFDAVAALFGGKTAPDWMLPSGKFTHFRDFIIKDIAVGTPASQAAAQAIANAENLAAETEAKLTAIRDARAVSTVGIDLDAIGNHLLYTAQNLENGVAHISEPVRITAVSIAKDILRKLKFSIGNKAVIDGLAMNPSDDLAALGALRGVGVVYERLLAWARSTHDATIFQHPSIIAATQAIGQLGYLSKLEGLRMAEMAGNKALAANISEQLKRVPPSFMARDGVTFGDLFDSIESGIDTILNRTQEVSVSGAKIGKSVDNRGTSMDAAPTAGLGNLLGADKEILRDSQLINAQQIAMLNHAQNHAQPAQNTPSAAQPQQQQSAGRSPGTGATLGRGQATQVAARTQRPSTSTVAAGMNPALMNEAQRKAASLAAFHALHDHEEHHHHDMMLQRQQILLNQQKLQAKAAAKAAAAKIDPAMLKGFKSATSLHGVTGEAITGKPKIDPKSVRASMYGPKTTVHKPTTETKLDSHLTTPPPLDDPTKQQPYTTHPQGHPPGRGGRGY